MGKCAPLVAQMGPLERMFLYTPVPVFIFFQFGLVAKNTPSISSPLLVSGCFLFLLSSPTGPSSILSQAPPWVPSWSPCFPSHSLHFQYQPEFGKLHQGQPLSTLTPSVFIMLDTVWENHLSDKWMCDELREISTGRHGLYFTQSKNLGLHSAPAAHWGALCSMGDFED